MYSRKVAMDKMNGRLLLLSWISYIPGEPTFQPVEMSDLHLRYCQLEDNDYLVLQRHQSTNLLQHRGLEFNWKPNRLGSDLDPSLDGGWG